MLCVSYLILILALPNAISELRNLIAKQRSASKYVKNDNIIFHAISRQDVKGSELPCTESTSKCNASNSDAKQPSTSAFGEDKAVEDLQMVDTSKPWQAVWCHINQTITMLKST